MQQAVRLIAGIALVWSLVTAAAVAPTSAQAQDGSGDGIFTLAGGLLETGSSGSDLYAASLTIEAGESLADPAAGAPGLVVLDQGMLLIERADGGRTVLTASTARFVTARERLTLTALGEEALAWRIAAVASGDDVPIEPSAGVGDPAIAELPGDDDAPEGALRPLTIGMGVIPAGETVQVGPENGTVSFLYARSGELTLDDGTEVVEGAIVSDGAGGPVGLSAEDNAVVGVIALGAAIDPTDLTGEGNLTRSTTNRSSTSRDDASSDDPAPDSDTGTDTGPDTGTGDDAGDPPDDGGADDGGADDGGDGTDDGTGEDLNDLDTDGDDLSDGFEIEESRTDPTKADTDGDGLNDSAEVMDLKSDPLNPDMDGDGLTDGAEVDSSIDGFATDWRDEDSDNDRLRDGEEQRNGANPMSPDTDGDGLNDGDEVLIHKTNPTSGDTDGDGLLDEREVESVEQSTGLKSNPTVSDTDGDGLSDGVEDNGPTDITDPDTDDDGKLDGSDPFPNDFRR